METNWDQTVDSFDDLGLKKDLLRGKSNNLNILNTPLSAFNANKLYPKAFFTFNKIYSPKIYANKTI